MNIPPLTADPAVPPPAAALASVLASTTKMRESADIAKIAPALVRAQGAMENPPRNRSVQVRTQAGSYTFRYATLDKITDMTRHALAENGLCLLQPIVGTERGPALVTRLLHESGQWMECEVLLPALGNNPQAFGSAVTYIRRYSVCALLNISADEDDDANAAAGNQVTASREDRGTGRDRARPQQRQQPTPHGEAPGDGGEHASGNGAADPWVYVSRQDGAKPCATRAGWEREWSRRIGSGERANRTAAARRETLDAMLSVNADAFVTLRAAGHGEAVGAVERLVAAADGRLANARQVAPADA